MRALKEILKPWLRFVFEFFQYIGINVLPKHFYSEIPDIRQLKNDRSWLTPRSLIGVAGVDTESQMDFIAKYCGKKNREFINSNNIHDQACLENGHGGFGKIESDFLHCFISQQIPKKIIQIGCGVSTAVILRALKEEGHTSELICIDPYPNDFLRQKSQDEKIILIEMNMQAVPLSDIINLNRGDLLFIDSTHAVKPGSEVNKLIYEVLPRLKPGVFVHFHDIHFPYDYQRSILSKELFFHNESNLLLAYLTDNQKYEIKASMSILHYKSPDKMKNFLPRYNPQSSDEGLKRGSEGHFPSSLYLLVKQVG